MKITVGELIERLSAFDSDAEMIFGDRALEFVRLKYRGTDPETGGGYCQMLFHPHVWRDSSGQIVVDGTDD